MEKRNYGIDLLRILSMFMIVILHILGNGGILSSCKVFTIKYELAWLLEIICYCAVNCYALISGYVLYDKKVKYSSMIRLWLQVFFYSVVICLIFILVGNKTLDLEQIIMFFLPVISRQYWYFTAYFGLFIFIPVFNFIVANIDRKILKRLLISCLCLFTVLPTVLYKDSFYFKNGYSMIWLMILYLFGAYFHKYKINCLHSSKKYIALYIVNVLLAFLSKYILEKVTFFIFGSPSLGNTFIHYNSLFIVFSAFGLFLLFVNLNIKHNLLIKAIKLFSPLTFSVYLIHTHPLVFNNILHNSFVFISKYSIGLMFIFILISAFMIYLICSFIDWMRIQLFTITKVEYKLINIIYKIVKRLSLYIDF